MRRLTITLLGLLGGVLLAVAAWLGGAKPDTDLKSNLQMALSRPGTAAAIGVWALGLAALGVAWWHARKADWSLRAVLATAALWAAPLLFAPPLGSRDLYAYACQGATVHGGLNPYEVGSAALPCPWLDSVSLIWHDTPAPYGPVWVLLAGAAVAVAGGNLAVAVTVLRVGALLGVLLMAYAVPRLAARAGVDPVRAAWLGLASPLLMVHVVSGGHNDALMIGLALCGLLAAFHRRGLASGALLGAAVAVKATAGIALPFAVLLLMRERTFRELLRRTWAPLAGTVAVFAAITLASGLRLGWLRGLASSGDSVQWTSPPTAVGMAVGALSKALGHDVTTGAVEVARVIGWAALAVALVVIWVRAYREARDPGAILRHLTGALVAVVALSPVFHPWYVLWPLAVLAVSVHTGRLRTAGEVLAVALPALTLPDGDNLALRTKLAGAVAMTGLVIATIVFGLRRLRLGRRPAPVRPRREP
ncbi:polyprenol phosphomannose-dependent alpha 1,6 mannosyltransferase MptB [Phytomonospora sp. NPDC050363]|uniref:polyprenol phosphomannose-dependent alpha 1,6 mannosyltransferase MptB n=1 Tax=Phytomonospora sp. NPDC050363 TaxID=3155642 RepID=UPI00340E37E7